MEGGLPDAAEIHGAVDKLPEGELSSVVSRALALLPAETRSQFGGLFSQFPGQDDAAGIASGDSGALRGALRSLLKREGGLGNLVGFSGGDAINLAEIMNNPLARTVLTALIPAILKAFQGK